MTFVWTALSNAETQQHREAPPSSHAMGTAQTPGWRGLDFPDGLPLSSALALLSSGPPECAGARRGCHLCHHRKIGACLQAQVQGRAASRDELPAAMAGPSSHTLTAECACPNWRHKSRPEALSSRSPNLILGACVCCSATLPTRPLSNSSAPTQVAPLCWREP